MTSGTKYTFSLRPFDNLSIKSLRGHFIYIFFTVPGIAILFFGGGGGGCVCIFWCFFCVYVLVCVFFFVCLLNLLLYIGLAIGEEEAAGDWLAVSVWAPLSSGTEIHVLPYQPGL